VHIFLVVSTSTIALLGQKVKRQGHESTSRVAC